MSQRPLLAQVLFQDALSMLPLPSVLSLRDVEPTHTAWLSLGALPSPESSSGAELQVRSTVGGRVRIFDEPLTLGASLSLDASGEHAPVSRRGHGDVLADLTWHARTSERVGVLVSASFWIPTSVPSLGLPSPRIAPSLQLMLRAGGIFLLRTRQGLIADLGNDGALLWASAYGLDVSFAGWLALGAELESSLGHGSAGQMTALSMGGGLRARIGRLEALLGARVAVTGDARDTMGSWAAVVGLRASFGAPSGR